MNLDYNTLPLQLGEADSTLCPPKEAEGFFRSFSKEGVAAPVAPEGTLFNVPLDTAATAEDSSTFNVQRSSFNVHRSTFNVAGTPRPYAVSSDNVLTASLILCFVVFVVALSHQGWLLARQAKDLLNTHHNSAEDVPLTHLGFHLFMMLVCCHLLAIASYIFAIELLHYDFSLEPQSLVVAVFLGLFLAYFLLKWMAYSFVNGVFFGKRARQQWTLSYLLLVALEAVLLFPLVLLLVYFDINAEKALFALVFIVFLNKILTFYKAWSIFFREKTLSLQIFLYFCTLEIMPMLAMGGIWLMMTNQLRVNY
ncbi:MAG: DUF4271 domain-containing protein [Prevotella sp.]|nr:DUF4271 domain-containing protein [Prevotella sp.]